MVQVTEDRDVIERMREQAIKVLRGYGWTVSDMSGEGYAQLDEALKAAARVLLEHQTEWARLVVGAGPGSPLRELPRNYARSIGIDLNQEAKHGNMPKIPATGLSGKP